MSAPSRSSPYLTILVEKRYGGHQHVHAGLARWGIGRPMCNDNRILFEFPIAANHPDFRLDRQAGWRHRWAEAFLELNRGCQDCLAQLYQIADEVGWQKHGRLKEPA